MACIDTLGVKIEPKSWRAATVVAVWLGLLQPGPAASKQYAYVTSEGANAVAVIDTESDAVIQRIPISIGSSDVALSPDGRLAYVVNQYAGSLTVIDLETRAVIDRIAVGNFPRSVAVTADGRYAFVTGQPTVKVDLSSGAVTQVLNEALVRDVAIGSMGRSVYVSGTILGPPGSGVVVIDADGRVTNHAALGYSARAIARSTDGRYIYLTATAAGAGAGRVVGISTVTLDVLLDVTLDDYPLGDIAVTPDGSKIYATSLYGGTLYLVDAAGGSRRILDITGAEPRLAMAPDGGRVYASGIPAGFVSVIDTSTQKVVARIAVGSGAAGMTASPDGKVLYVAADDGVHVVDTGSNTVVATVPGGLDPTGIAATPDGRTLYVANQASGSLAVIDPERGLVTDSIQTGGNPLGVAVTPDGRRAYVTSFRIPGSVFVIDTATNTQVGAIDVPGEAGGIAITPDGSRVFVANNYYGVISMIDTATDTVGYEFEIAYRPKGMAISRDGTFALVATELPPAVQIFDPRATTPSPISGRIDLSDFGYAPCAIALASDGSRAYTADVHEGFVNAIDPANRAVVASTSVVNTPFVPNACGIALTSDDRRLYVANHANNLVTVLAARDLHLLHHIPVPPHPYEIAIACPGGCPTPTPPPCNGDCNRDGTVTVDELFIGVGVTLDRAPLAACASLDQNDDGRVTIDELALAVDGALDGCQPLP